MISIKRLLLSLLAGGLLVLLTAGQAGAQRNTPLEQAMGGVQRGLGSVAHLLTDDGDVVASDHLAAALTVYDDWVERHLDSGRQGAGQGPVRAQEVHEMLLNGEIPGQINRNSHGKLGDLDAVYLKLKDKSDELEKHKAEKDKADKDKDTKGGSSSSEGKAKGDSGLKGKGSGRPNPGGNSSGGSTKP